MIRKFKNGNIVLDIREDIKKGYFDIENIENFYHDEMCMEDLYINQINGYLYIADYNTGLVYDLPGGYRFEDFIKELLNKGKFKLIPYGKRISKELFNDLENGY